MTPYSQCSLCEGTGEIRTRTMRSQGTGPKSRCPRCYQDPCPGCDNSPPRACARACDVQAHVAYSASGGRRCICTKPVSWHPYDATFISYKGPWLRILCNGDRVKVMEDLEPKPEPKPPIIQAELLPVDTALPSGRTYPKEVMEEAIREIKPFMVMRKVLGEFVGEKAVLGDTVTLSDAAVLVISLYFKGSMLMADLEILSTPRGEILKEYLRSGGAISAVGRGTGETSEDGVVRTYKFVTVDVLEVTDET